MTLDLDDEETAVVLDALTRYASDDDPDPEIQAASELAWRLHDRIAAFQPPD